MLIQFDLIQFNVNAAKRISYQTNSVQCWLNSVGWCVCVCVCVCQCYNIHQLWN